MCGHSVTGNSEVVLMLWRHMLLLAVVLVHRCHSIFCSIFFLFHLYNDGIVALHVGNITPSMTRKVSAIRIHGKSLTLLRLFTVHWTANECGYLFARLIFSLFAVDAVVLTEL